MSYDPNSLPVGGSDAIDYWNLGWDDASVQGGISTSDDVINAHDGKETLGESPLPPGPTELPPGILGEEDEDLIVT